MLWPDYMPLGAGSSARELLATIASCAASKAPPWLTALDLVELVRVAPGPARSQDVAQLNMSYAALNRALTEARNPGGQEPTCIVHLQGAIPA